MLLLLLLLLLLHVRLRGAVSHGLAPVVQCANWLLYYRQALYGISLEELMAKKAQDVEAENLRLREAGQNIKSAKGPELR
jgi:hypothetical protein